MNIFQIFPNTYIIFVADSGRMRKSTAIKYAGKILSRTDPGPKMIAQKVTPEALIDALRTTHSESKELFKETCGGIVVADELVTFLNRDSYNRGLGSFLTEMWDCPEKYEYRTRGRPTEEINYGHLSLLGGTTVHNLRDAIPLEALGDGFSSRVLFVYEDKVTAPVPRPTHIKGFHKLEEDLILHLQGLTDLSGELTLTPQAAEYFDDEYIQFYNSKFYDDLRFQAYSSRRDKHLLKVAICLMAADQPSMELDREYLERATYLLADLESHYEEVFDRITMTESGSITEQVLSVIKSEKILERSALLKKFSKRISADDMAKITLTLIQSGRVRLDSAGGQVLYIYKED